MVPSDLTRTWRKKPVRSSCARPSASFASVLLILQERAALAWRAAMHTTGRPAFVSPWQSQVASWPVSSPTRSTAGACRRIVSARAATSVGHVPRQRQRPCSSTMCTLVDRNETSRATYSAMPALPSGVALERDARTLRGGRELSARRDHAMSRAGARPRRRPLSSSSIACAPTPRRAAGTRRRSTSSALRRPGLDRLHDAASRAQLDRVLITAPDRLARNYVHQTLLVEVSLPGSVDGCVRITGTYE